MSDLAAEMSLPVLVVAQNRLGCLNHTALTVRSIAEHGLCCSGVVLNGVPEKNDIASMTNLAILKKIVDVPLFTELTEDLIDLPVDWRLMIHSARTA
jgi:dethiobiotin synthetase